MMEIETRTEARPGSRPDPRSAPNASSGGAQHRSHLSAPAAPEMTRTRCPGCQKLFAVETETLNAMARAGVVRAEFNCTGELCHEIFAIPLPLPANASSLTVLPAMRLEKISDTANARSNQSERPSDRPLVTPIPPRDGFEPARVAAVEAPLRDRQPEAPLRDRQPEAPLRERTLEAPLLRSPETAPNVISAKVNAGVNERECPRCGAMNAVTMNDCVRCGIIFDRYVDISDAQLEEEMALGGTRELSALWDKVLEDYEDRIRHDRFLNACRDANALSYASKKYSQILVAAPQDDIARLMRNRIVSLISVRAESSKLPIRLSFRIPKINSLALFGGSILFFWGLFMPQLKNVMEIGLSLVLLSIGVRLALRARI